MVCVYMSNLLMRKMKLSEVIRLAPFLSSRTSQEGPASSEHFYATSASEWEPFYYACLGVSTLSILLSSIYHPSSQLF